MLIEEGGNIYGDIGASNPEEMLRKAELMDCLGNAMESKGLDIARASIVLGIDDYCLSQWLIGQFSNTPEEILQSCLTKLEKAAV